MNHVNIEIITVVDTLPLRQQILRPHQALSECVYKGDDLDSTVHFAAIEDDEIIGIMSLYQRNCLELGSTNGMQLRAMATAIHSRGQGIGFKLLAAAESHAQKIHTQYIWANARVEAINFYKKSAYTINPQQFEIKGVGPHQLVSKLIFVKE
ncbi:MAG: GNAT family N-acetyltransferase [Gammaproteobacteria bacterium]|nr:MAG: GNAT family N-acetyltransferase [Gammaproteobacteria bacterium]